MDVGTLSAALKLDTKGFDKNLKKGVKGFESLKGSIVSLNQALDLASRGMRGLRVLKDRASEWIELAGAQQQAQAGMNQAMVSMGRYSEEMEDRLLGMASALQDVTTFGDEATIEGTKFLLTYRQIGDEILPEAQEAMLDLAALMGGDTRQAANMLGKASMGMAGELRRVGITIDSTVAKSGDFKAILKEIQAQVGGQARALARTGYGGMLQMGNLMGDIKEKLGDMILSIMQFGGGEGVAGILKTINKELKEFQESSDFRDWASYMANAFISTINLMIKAISFLIARFYDIRLGLSKMAEWFAKIQEWVAKTSFKIAQTMNKAANKLGLLSDETLRESEAQYEQSLIHARSFQNAMQDMWKENFEAKAKWINKINSLQIAPLTEKPQEVKPKVRTPKGAPVNAEYTKLVAQAKSVAKELQKTLDGVTFDKQTAHLSEYGKELVTVNAEHGRLIEQYQKFFEAAPMVKNSIDEIREAKLETIFREAGNEVYNLLKDTQFEQLTADMNGHQKAMADINREYEEMVRHYEVLFDKVPGLSDKLDQVKQTQIDTYLAQTKNNLEKLIEQAQFEGSLLGLDEEARLLAETNWQFRELVETFPELQVQVDLLAQTKLDKFREELELTATKMFDFANVAKDALNGMKGPLADFFMTFAESGKLAFKDLAAALIKQLRMIAAQKTAHLLMEAAYQGIMAIVKTAMRDPAGAALHMAASVAALKGAAIMGGFVIGSGLAGMAHHGMSEIPEDGTWLLKKGERVVDDRTNEDLKGFLKQKGSGGGVNMTVHISGGDEQGVLNALPQLREAVLDAVNDDIRNGGKTRNTIIEYVTS
jgi:hypothetical protein